MAIEEKIKVHGDFSLSSSINAMRRNTPGEKSDRSAEIHLSHEVSGGAIEIFLRQEEPDADLVLRLHGDSVNTTVMLWARERLVRMLSLSIDGREFYDIVNRDPHLRLAAAICPNLRPVLYMTPYEGVMTSILRKGLDMKQAVNIIRNVCEVAGIVPYGCPTAPPAFPGKLTLLAMSDRLLEIAGLPFEKIKMAKDFASHLVGDPDPLEYLESVFDTERAVKILSTLPGINTMTGMHLIQYAYGHPDMILDGPRLRKAIKRFYNLPTLPDATTIKRLSEPFVRWRSWWTFLLITANETSVIV